MLHVAFWKNYSIFNHFSIMKEQPLWVPIWLIHRRCKVVNDLSKSSHDWPLLGCQSGLSQWRCLFNNTESKVWAKRLSLWPFYLTTLTTRKLSMGFHCDGAFLTTFWISTNSFDNSLTTLHFVCNWRFVWYQYWGLETPLHHKGPVIIYGWGGGAGSKVSRRGKYFEVQRVGIKKKLRSQG